MTLEDLEKKYLESQLKFLSKQTYLEDASSNFIWENNGINENNISVISSAYNYFNQPSQLSHDHNMTCLCIKTQKQNNITSNNSSIFSKTPLILGGRSFTIDFWMNLTTEKYFKNQYPDIISGVRLLWEYNKSEKFYNMSLKTYNELIVYNYGFNLTYCDNKISIPEKRYKQINGIISKQISEQDENNLTVVKDTSIYFTPNIINTITDDSLTYHHLILSYNTQYSINHPNNKDVLNFYIDGIDYIDKNQYKSVPVLRNNVTIHFYNYTTIAENSFELCISKFRIWDGVAIEISKTGELMIFDEDLNNEEYYIDNRDSGYKTQYDNMLYTE